MAKKGGKSAASPHVDQLVAKGFSKAKAAQALRDAGNNYQVALRILERQREQQAAREAKPVARQAAPVGSSLSPAGPVDAHNEGEGCDPSAAAASTTAKSVPLHPCIVQYKCCQFGQFCRLRNMPGDVCINYFNGSCIYGDFCRRRHIVDGVDIRASQRREISDTFTREDGTRYRIVTAGNGGKTVQVAQLVYDSDGEDACASSRVLQGKVVSAPDASDFNLIRGSEPTHTDPLPHTSLRGGLPAGQRSGSSHAALPQPFLEKLVSDAPRSGSAAPVRVGSTPQGTADGTAAASAVVKGRRKHPCVAQCGSCKYGAACEHADRDADVCVHFLNGRCRFSAEDCRYRHETDEEYSAKLMGEKRFLSARDALATSPPPAALQARKKKNRLQGGVSSGSDHGHTTSRVGSPAPDGAASALAYGFLTNPACGDATSGGGGGPLGPSPASAADFFPMPDVAEGVGFAGGDWVVSGHDRELAAWADGAADAHSAFLRDNELSTFLGLLEAFPQEEPAFVLQALRSAGGDAVAVADLVGRVEETTASDVDAQLAKALAEEEETEMESDRRSRELVAKSEELLTLQHLFPALELGSIEAVYHRRDDNFEEAYEALLCSQENATRRDYGNVWRGNVNPAEQLRLEKVKAMFPEIHPDIIRSTFGASDKDSKRTVAALNQLTSELLSHQTRVRMGAAATRWRPRAPVPAPPPARLSSTSAVADVVTAEAEVQRLYKAAEAELRAFGDWRRVRFRAYGVNTCRLRVLSQASAAYLRGDGALAKALSQEGYELGAEYERLNRLAMLALEMERLREDPATTIDLHGFHASEALEVLTRRVDLCQRKRIRFLSIVVGEGHHSRRGEATLLRAVTDFVETDPRMRAALRLVSVQPGCLTARVILS